MEDACDHHSHTRSVRGSVYALAALQLGGLRPSALRWPRRLHIVASPRRWFPHVDLGRISCRARHTGGRSATVRFRAEIGRASCRESVCQYVEISVVDGSLKQKKSYKRSIYNKLIRNP